MEREIEKEQELLEEIRINNEDAHHVETEKLHIIAIFMAVIAFALQAICEPDYNLEIKKWTMVFLIVASILIIFLSYRWDEVFQKQKKIVRNDYSILKRCNIQQLNNHYLNDNSTQLGELFVVEASKGKVPKLAIIGAGILYNIVKAFDIILRIAGKTISKSNKGSSGKIKERMKIVTENTVQYSIIKPIRDDYYVHTYEIENLFAWASMVFVFTMGLYVFGQESICMAVSVIFVMIHVSIRLFFKPWPSWVTLSLIVSVVAYVLY